MIISLLIQTKESSSHWQAIDILVTTKEVHHISLLLDDTKCVSVNLLEAKVQDVPWLSIGMHAEVLRLDDEL